MLYYEEFGDKKKPTIILLPGAGMADTFYHQYKYSDRFHFVAVHLLGIGEEAAKEWSLKDNVNGILEIIEKIGKEKVTVVGFSMGAQVVVPLLCARPSAFNGAIIISAWLIKPAKKTARMCKIMKLMSFMDTVPFLVEWQAKTFGYDEKTKAKFIKQAKLNRKDNYDRFTWDGVEIKDYPAFGELTMPILALCGAKENEELMIASTRALGSMNPNCKVKVCEGHAHDLPHCRPEEFNQIFLKFMEDLA